MARTFEDPGEILEAVKAMEGTLENLRTRMDDDFYELYALDDYEPQNDPDSEEGKGYEHFTTTSPRNFFDTAESGINRARLTLSITLPDDSEEADRTAASEGELFLFGALDAVDRRRRSIAEPSLRKALTFHGLARGWVAMRALAFVPEGEEDTVFDVAVWDMLHVTWEMGPNGLLWMAFKRPSTKSQLEAEYGEKAEGMSGDITDFWTPEANAILIGGEFVKDINDEDSQHGIGHVPGLILPVGSMPTILTQSEGRQDTIEFQGESVWGMGRKLVKPRNRYISRLMDMQRRSVAGTLIHQSKTGKKSIEGDPYRGFREIRTDKDEKITPLELPKPPAETFQILGVIDNEWQEVTHHGPLAYGGATAAESGRALAIRNEAARTIYGPITDLLAEAYTWLAQEFLHQFATVEDIKTAELSGYNNEGEFFRVTTKPKTVDPSWRVEVKVEPRLPRDEEADAQMFLALTSKQSPDEMPALSKRTGRADILKLRDPDAEERRILVEQGKNNPAVRTALIAEALEEAGEKRAAELVVELFEGQPGPQPAPGPEGAAAGAGPEGAMPGPGGQPQPTPTPGQAPGPQIPQPLAEAILNVLVGAGRQAEADAFVRMVEAGAPPDPQFLVTIVRILEQAGRQDIVLQLFKALGIESPAAAGAAAGQGG